MADVFSVLHHTRAVQACREERREGKDITSTGLMERLTK